MRLLLIHAKKFHYRTTRKALKKLEERKDIPHEGEYENTLVVFTTIEQDDDIDVIEKAVQEIINVAKQVKPKHILVYPYAHLSSNLAPPNKALKLLDKLVEKLREKESIEVSRAPFGYYKEFILHCYGHPLAELSKTIRKEKIEERRAKIHSIYIFYPDDRVVEARSYTDIEDQLLKRILERMLSEHEQAFKNNIAIDYCRKFGFNIDENRHGHYTYKAKIMIDLVSKHSSILAGKLDIPLYRFERPIISSDELLPPMDVKSIKHKDIYGLLESTIILQDNLKGRITPCINQPYYHASILHLYSIKDLDTLLRLLDLLNDLIVSEISVYSEEYVPLVDVANRSVESSRELIEHIVKSLNKPVVARYLQTNNGSEYVRLSYNIFDNSGNLVEISWITIVERGGFEIHTSLIGLAEKYVYLVLDSAARLQLQGRTPFIPTWLSPIQVRVIPVRILDEYVEYSRRIVEALIDNGFRADMDLRDTGLGRRIRDAGREWIPYIVVIGERELKSDTLNIRIRRTNDQLILSLNEFIPMLKKDIGEHPIIEQYSPIQVSG